jgi:hypothetical protein
LVLPSLGFSQRTLLGSAPPCKLSATDLLHRRRLAISRRDRRAVDAARGEILAGIRAALASAGVDAVKAERAAATAGGSRSRDGVPRGQCPRCNACPGFCPPKLLPTRLAEWRAYCAHCGCEDLQHEPLREPEAVVSEAEEEGRGEKQEGSVPI